MGIKLPDWQELGQAPGVSGARPVASYDPSPLARSAQALGQGIEKAGLGIGELELDKGRYQYHAAHADLVTNSIAQYDQLQGDTDYASMTKRYGDQYEKNRQKAAEGIDDPQMRQLFLSNTQDAAAQFNSNIYKHSYKLAGDARAAYRSNYASTIINKVPDLPSDAERRNALDAYNGLVDADVAAQHMTAEQGVTEKKRIAEHYATTSALADIQKDPLAARKALSNPDPNSLYSIIPLETRLRLTDHARTIVGTQAGEAAISSASSGASVPMLPSSGGGFQPVVNVEPPKTGLVTINAAGKSLTVHSSVAPQFKGFIEELASQGAPIHDIGSYNDRNIAGTDTLSQHAFGTAIDINQSGRNKVSADFADWAQSHQGQLREALEHWGIVSGGDWKDPDFGHFEVKGAAAATAGQVIPAVIGTPATAASLKADAYRRVMDNRDLTPQERHAALTYINQSTSAAEIAAETTQRQQKEQSDVTLGTYLDRIAKGDFGQDGSIAREALGDNRMLPATRESLARFAAEASGDRGQLVEMGPGWLDAKKAILSRPGTPGHIADPSEIMERALPGGDLTPAGARDLTQTMQLARKSPDEYGLQETKHSLQTYAKNKLGFEVQFPTGGGIKSPSGSEYFESNFIPKFNAAYGRWVGAGKDPWEFLTKENIDKLMSDAPPKAKIQGELISASGAQAPEEPIPPAPKDTNADAWGRLMSNRPLTAQGAPIPVAAWAQAIEKLRSDPSPEKVKLFNESKFGAWGFRGEDIIRQLAGRNEAPAPLSPAAPAPLIPIGP